MKLKIKKLIKTIFLFIIIFVIFLAFFSTCWALNSFEFLNFDEIIFQLTTPIDNASSSILNDFLMSSLFPTLFCSFVVAILFFIVYDFLNCQRFYIKINLWKKEFILKFRSKYVKTTVNLLICLVFLGVTVVCLDKITFFDYVHNLRNPSTFIEENYVDPKDVTIKSPDTKRNLIFIFSESLESTFFSTEYGGGSSFNYLEPLVDLTKNNLHFSNSEKFGGATTDTGASWTSAAMVSYTSGLPLKVSSDQIKYNENDLLISNVYNFGDILKENGYNQEILFGSDGDFGKRKTFFSAHGYEVYDYYTAIEKGKIKEDYYEWWGFEDSKLFEYAKEEILKHYALGEPFNITLLTANTHAIDGHIDDNCTGDFSTKYGNAIYCSAIQIREFVDWIKSQEFYPNTTIVIVGDHISMQPSFYPDNVERHIYNLFINPLIYTDNNLNRQFKTFDFFPTTLASLGFEIEGDRLSLGTNLFSDKKTLTEEFGNEYLEQELEKYSEFYMEKFYDKK